MLHGFNYPDETGRDTWRSGSGRPRWKIALRFRAPRRATLVKFVATTVSWQTSAWLKVEMAAGRREYELVGTAGTGNTENPPRGRFGIDGMSILPPVGHAVRNARSR